MSKKISYSVGSLALILFLLVAVWVKMKGTTAPIAFDSSIQKFAYHLQSSHALTRFFSDYTGFFGDMTGYITAGVVILALFVLGERVGAVYFALLAAFSTVVNELIKHFIHRIRPDTHRVLGFAHQSGFSFASGHSLFATILFGSLLLILWRYLKSSPARLSLIIGAIFLTLLVMFSRIFVGVHYPTDTVAGFLEGLVFLTFSAPTFVKYNQKYHQS
ncbi:phosphatase PAP2 family protein [Lactococcus nasutitermitis]|uniref:Phosphatase PAP2 family protein n=1 Tax=Lactococcus nasutitermitis TaxID=1652957 RepID=A0ABV9JBM0_9LACT|nr:phosphatase PAP2 family protein [Lactococcus nasutitermitis]